MVHDSWEIRPIDWQRPEAAGAARALLATRGLRLDTEPEYTIGAYEGDRLVGTGSFSGKVLRNLAVAEEQQGEGLLAAIITQLVEEQRRRGRYHYLLYTRPDKVAVFESLGFRLVAEASPYAALLEAGLGSVADYCTRIATQAEILPDGPRATLVVNCNPFTLGHQGLIRQAARDNRAVIVFVVSEDRSLFPFATRLQLVRQGTADLKNVLVVSGEEYIISAATFPAYFTRDEETVAAQTRLDAAVFAQRLAPPLGIRRRYVGEEPYCAVTLAYNQALQDVLPGFGIEVTVLPRFAVGGEVISASKVREFLRQGDWEGVRRMVPDTTMVFLRSPEAQPIIDRIKHSQARH